MKPSPPTGNPPTGKALLLSLTFLALTLLALILPQASFGVSAIQAKWTEPPTANWATLSIFTNGTLTRFDLLTAAVACGTSKCIDLAVPARNVSTTYMLRACNSLNECVDSNSVSLLLPGLPAVPALSITITP